MISLRIREQDVHTCMRSHMRLQDSAGDKTAVALSAFVGLLSRVTANVLLQMTALLEGGDAKTATERTIQQRGKS